MAATTLRMDAARAGKSTYEGKPCKTCGSTWKRTVSGACVACSAAAAKAHKDKVRDTLNAAKA